MLFRHACIGDRDIDVTGLLQRGFEILPARCVTFDEGRAEGRTIRGRCEVENEGFGAFCDKDSDGCKANA